MFWENIRIFFVSHLGLKSSPVYSSIHYGRRKSGTHHPLLKINNASVNRVLFHKHLALILDSKLDFNEHIKLCCQKLTK